jgi:phage shock protein PspC (stress-responsive transcriptional regulator)
MCIAKVVLSGVRVGIGVYFEFDVACFKSVDYAF